MNHTAIVQGTGALAETVQYLNSLKPPVPLNIAEFGSALNPGPNDYALESVLGSALWQVDFMLWLLAIGVSRAHIQLGIGFGFAAWQPVDYKGIPAKVNAPYYAHVLIADFIGLSRTMQIINVDMESDTFSVYGAYDEGYLSKIAIVNLEFWSSQEGDGGDRPWINADLDVPKGTKYAELKRLTSSLGATASDTQDITWDGLSWTWESSGLGRRINRQDVESVAVVNGRLTVAVAASEAVVIVLKS